MIVQQRELAGLTLARQFPEVASGEPDQVAVAELVGRTGAIQAQAARSAFIGLAARWPGVQAEAITAAYESHLIVRGSTIRGTVHTSTAADHGLLDVATRVGQRSMWARTLQLAERSLEQVWAGIEEFAWHDWRTPADLTDHLVSWVAREDPTAQPQLDGQTGRYLACSHPGLIRRPLKQVTGAWAGQSAPGYRAAAAVLGDPEHAEDDALDRLFRSHLSAHGPATRHDLSWWSGVPQAVVDASLRRLDPEIVEVGRVDDRTYLDLRCAPPARDLDGVRLLGDFDALLLGYQRASRGRFIDPEFYPLIWNRANGLISPTVLVDDRIVGGWRLTGSGRRRGVEVWLQPGVRAPRRSLFDDPVRALEAALDITVTGLSVT